MITIQEILKEINYLPVFNHVAQKALQILADDMYSPKELAATIKYDAALTANILKVSNSAYFAHSIRISDIATAINFLGKNQLYSIISISAAQKYFTESDLGGYEINPGELWDQSLSVAIISEEVRRFAPEVDGNTLFISALLHDIGKIVLSKYIHGEYAQIARIVEDESIDFTTAEKRVLGFSHPMVGARVLKHWNFSDTMINVAKYHHEPEKTDDIYVHMVCLSLYIAYCMGIMSQVDSMQYEGFDYLLDKYGFQTKDIDAIESRSLEKISKILFQLLG